MGRLADELGAYNYGQLFADAYYADTLKLSLEISLAATALTLLVAFPVAYVIARMRSRWASSSLPWRSSSASRSSSSASMPMIARSMRSGPAT